MISRVIAAAERTNRASSSLPSFFSSWRMISMLASSPLYGTRAIDMAARDGELRIFTVAGEVSGDAIASRLMASLRILSPFPVRFAGVGGALMHKEGLKSLFPMEDISVMGLWELLPYLNKIRRRLKETVEAAISFQPHVVVTVDSKGFSFRFLRQLKARSDCKQSALHVHYVAPSFWAWKGGEARLKGLREFVDHLLCILPFEEEVCRANGLPATYVGHPMLEDHVHLNEEMDGSVAKWKVQRNGDGFRQEHGLSPGATVITLLPGSRLQEVKRMLPIFSKTVEQLKDTFTDLSTIIPLAPNRQVETYINREIQSWPVPNVLISGSSLSKKYDAFSASRAALCTSGTAVMELLLAGLPCVVAYRAHILTEWLIRYRTMLKCISLPNILLNSPIIPEVLFQECTPNNLSMALSNIMLDEAAHEQQRAAAMEVFELLWPSKGNPGSSLIQELGSSLPSCCPSMVAASTILHSVVKQ
ncbi:LOW QUALITY PROTEIN: probable lipid-A-disaccharide synthase, mitochondrial [Dioscorea cayenensis subsp. rotundata]|uniref:lipid-A-disaccharide synthase n=1 Tax=Dioscorea cayennensis subsp. rotundata TaxID=55577 RepID=A0AB40D0C3_DIOCR|nr:LOW QUALITY PROTEIN: probable lipid-A-disaccharide synthase, mitochondrial [Dioscorea cayenensis subsp. rotundata]